jgi:hypothetical protein
MTACMFIVSVIWGALSAQFLLQSLVSLIIGGIYLVALPFSPVSKILNLTGGLIGLGQFVMFAALFGGGNWITSSFIGNHETWNANSIAKDVAFLASLIAMAPQVPGKLLLARRCAWNYAFFEAQNVLPRHERVAFAKRYIT